MKEKNEGNSALEWFERLFVLTYSFCLEHLDQDCRCMKKHKKEKKIVICQCKKIKNKNMVVIYISANKSTTHNNSTTKKCKYLLIYLQAYYSPAFLLQCVLLFR